MPTAKAVIAAGTVALAAVGLAGLLVVHRAQPATGGKPPPLSTTSMENWTASVCRPGSFQDGGAGLPNATGTGHCSGRKAGDTVMVGTYATRQSLDSDVSRDGGEVYATIQLTSGEIFAFLASLPQDPAVLDPLSKYGFALHRHVGSVP